MKRYFHKELEALRDHLVVMSEKAGESVQQALNALRDGDLALAAKVREDDNEIDQLEVRIDHEAIRYMTLRQPMAHDMRLVAVAIKVSHDLERIGDEATNIAKRVKRIHGAKAGKMPTMDGIMAMGEMATEMLHDTIAALLGEDMAKLISIIRQDKQVDALNRSNYKTYSQSLEDANGMAVPLLELIFISKSLERIADHVTNMAEEVIYLFSGAEVRHAGLKKGGSVEDLGGDS